MAFSPSLSICFITCKKISFTDSTNVYNALTNPEGWGPANGVIGSMVDTAIITVLNSEGDTVFTYDVSSQIPDPVTGDIVFTDYDVEDFGDGEYIIDYTITLDNNDIYTKSISILNTCNFEACIDSLLATVPAKICEDACNTAYIDEVLLVEGLLYAYQCAAICEKDTIKEEINKRLQRFCDFTCDDC